MSTVIEKLAFVLVYATDLKTSIQFYQKHFGYVVDPKVKMSENEAYGQMGTVGLWIGGGYKQTEQPDKVARAGVMLRVKSAHELYDQLKKDEIKLYQLAPVQMQENSWWFQLGDPSGNVIDILGNK